MGVLEPVVEAFDEEVPSTPPGARDLATEDNSEDDLFAESNEGKTQPLNSKYEFYNNILPEMPSKWDFEDLLDLRGLKPTWGQAHAIKKKKYCSGCLEDVKKDLNTLAKVVEDYRNERDTARSENALLKKELEELKKLLKEKEDDEKRGVKVTISNSKEESVDVFVRDKNVHSTHGIISKEITQNNLDCKTRYGIQNFSISLQKEATQPLLDSIENSNTLQTSNEFKSKKTVADLRREFFAKEFQSEQKTFKSKNYLVIKPEQNTVRSSLTIRVKPKQKITELISKLTSKFSHPNVIPEVPQISMFQRFEKTRFVWQSDSKKCFV